MVTFNVDAFDNISYKWEEVTSFLLQLLMVAAVLEVVFNALLDEVNYFNNEIKMKMSPSQKKPAM